MDGSSDNGGNAPSVTIDYAGQHVELLADQLGKLSNAAERLMETGLSERALVVLLQDYTGLGKRDIRLVLRALPRLGPTYLELPDD